MDKPQSSFMQVFKHVKTLSITFVVTFLVLICAYAIFEKRDVDTDRAFLARVNIPARRSRLSGHKETA